MNLEQLKDPMLGMSKPDKNNTSIVYGSSFSPYRYKKYQNPEKHGDGRWQKQNEFGGWDNYSPPEVICDEYPPDKIKKLTQALRIAVEALQSVNFLGDNGPMAVNALKQIDEVLG